MSPGLWVFGIALAIADEAAMSRQLFVEFCAA
jgi:hypothetical protein